MSSANLELVRSAFAAYERGDLLATLDWADPGIEFVMVGGPEPGTWKGLAQVESFVRDYMSAWDGFRIQPDEYRELDGEHVLVVTHAGGRGRASGMEIGHEGGIHLYELREGKVIRMVFYWEHDRAFADLGLSPEGDAPA